MPSHRPSKLPLKMFLLVALVIAPIAFFASIPWLKEQPDDLVFLVGGTTSIVTVALSFWLSILQDRQLDEWNRANAGFANRWGWTTGACLIAVLLALPPFRELIVTLIAGWTDRPDVDPETVMITFTFGFMAVVMAQLFSTVVLSAIWGMWMSRAPREQA